MMSDNLLTPEEAEAREAFFQLLQDTQDKKERFLKEQETANKAKFFNNLYLAVSGNQQETFRKIDTKTDTDINLNSVSFAVWQTDYYKGRQIKDDKGKVVSEGIYQKTTYSIFALGIRIESETLAGLLTMLGSIKA